METIDALKNLQPLVESNEISDFDYEEIRVYVFKDPNRLINGYTTNRAIATLRRLFDSNKIDEETFNTLRVKVSEGYIEPINKQIINNVNEPSIKGPLFGFLLGFLLNFIGIIICVTCGDKKAKVASIITACIEIAIGLIITITLVTIFVIDPNIIFPNGL